eukprot:CAMPEP_0172163232 /NCGR_PEP_ID=MMETSP1050-20130122/7155_1 /TAXON_ID=233186 /ORGANISM="Cryptomonas curvata, Strain CCAP979/52" /LENGTH=73 /DNA_ID=CAMNT_0012833395 /DNA_START=110 /DNA_END=327 /DNA_ORIENTATION=+
MTIVIEWNRGGLAGSGQPDSVELLTRAQLDKVVPGCKWWYCAQSNHRAQAAAESARASHPGYTITETDSLPAG